MQVDAKKETHGKPEALEILQQVSKLVAARGKKISEINFGKDESTEDEILKLVLGPTGNLRAPTLRVGKKLVVGFNEEMYDAVFS